MSGPERSMDSTQELLVRAKAGDAGARDRLFARYLPKLRRWARGRLPRASRALLETDDVVQETAMNAFRRLDAFEPRHEGALAAYLRQAVGNRIRDEVRSVARRPVRCEIDDERADPGSSPLDHAIGADTLERLAKAFGRLRPADRELLSARLDHQLDYAQIAECTGRPSANAARVAVARALCRLAEEMDDES